MSDIRVFVQVYNLVLVGLS